MPGIENASAAGSHAGPLGVAWISHELGITRAGEDAVARLVLLNAGAATWRPRGEGGVRVSYHWLDRLRNPFVWDAPRTALPHPVAPGERVEISVVIRSPIPPGDYILAFDLVEEFQFWFSEFGLPMLEVPCTVQPRIDERRLGVVIHPGPGDAGETRAALALQDEPVVLEAAAAVAHLVAGCLPAPDWSRSLLDAHAEGFAAVGCAVVPETRFGGRRAWAWLEPWHPRAVRDPRFRGTLLLPSLVDGLDPSSVNGWPAFTPDPGVPQDQTDRALFDGRSVIKLRPRSGRRQR